MTEIKSQNGDKNMYTKRNYRCNHCVKYVLQCRILKATKTDVNGAKVQTTAKIKNKACFSQKFKIKNIVSKLKNVIMR